MNFSSHLPLSRRVTLNLEFLEQRHAPAIVGPLGTATLAISPPAGFDASTAQFVPFGPAGRNDTAQQLAPVTNNEAAAHTASAFSGGSLVDFVEQPLAPPTPPPVAPPAESLRTSVVTPGAVSPPVVEAPSMPADDSQPTPSVPAVPAIHRPAARRVEPASPTVEPSSAPQIRIDPPTPELPPPHPSPALSALGGVFVFGLAVPHRLGKPHSSKLSTAALPPRRDAVK
jgi:hypothetical protein